VSVGAKVVMITGASSGLGAELALGFAAAGARVSICARRGEPLERVAAQIERAGGECLATPVDVRDADAVQEWARLTRERMGGGPDVLINNASLLGSRVPLLEYPRDTWREVLDVNLTGVFVVTQAVVPLMLEKDEGSVINVSSGAARSPRERWGAYAVSKAAMEAFSFNLAEELKATGVRVNVVDPGPMRTDMRAAAYPDEDPETLAAPSANFPVFEWLASEHSSAVSGHRIHAGEWLRQR
jgi:NAD(P)-dependent dehydrogenase (short-subunit alcohol dehydrogenase family)